MYVKDVMRRSRTSVSRNMLYVVGDSTLTNPLALYAIISYTVFDKHAIQRGLRVPKEIRGGEEHHAHRQ